MMLFPTPKRFTLDEHDRLKELGFLTADDDIELIRGELIQMAARATPHSLCSAKLFAALIQLVGDRAVVRERQPIRLPPDSVPEPDVVILRGRPEAYLTRDPLPQDLVLVIEVSNTSLKYDRTTKLALYAENQICHYWLVNLMSKQIEQYSEVYQDSEGVFGYRSKQLALNQDRVELPEFSDLRLELEQVF